MTVLRSGNAFALEVTAYSVPFQTYNLSNMVNPATCTAPGSVVSLIDVSGGEFSGGGGEGGGSLSAYESCRHCVGPYAFI